MFERHVQKMSALYARKADVLSKSLSKLNHKEKKDDHTSHANTHKSKYIHTCIELSEMCSIKALEERGIKIADINEYYYQYDNSIRNYLPINVSNMDEKKIEAGLEKLYKNIKVYF